MAEASGARAATGCRRRLAVLRALAVFLQMSAATGLRSAEPAASPPGQLLAELNAVSIDPSQVYSLRGVRIRRDRVSLYFNRGSIGFFSKVAGEVTGAVFTGDGEVLMVPPDEPEKQSLARFTDSPILEERFSAVYLRFTDNTARELVARAQPPDPQALEQPAALVPAWDAMARRLNAGHSLRILEDLVSERRGDYFSAELDGLNLGVFEVDVDERRPEAVQVAALKVQDRVTYTDVWCSFRSRVQMRQANQDLAAARVRSYRISTRIAPDHTLEGRAELELESRSAPERFLAFELSRNLESITVTDERGTGIPAFQAASPEGSQPLARNDWIAVALPRGHPAGEVFRLVFTYRGNVIADAGNGVLYVGAHGSWYPNLGPSPHAIYDLSFDYPAHLTLVATGHLVEDSTSNGYRHSRWLSDGVFPLAGFNLGPYDSRARDLGDVRVEVYATQQAESALERRYLDAQAEAESEAEARSHILGRRAPMPPLPLPPLEPAALIGKVTDSAAETLRYFQTLFGPFPYPRLAISQVPGSFGQGWPELVYLPTLAFLPGLVLSELGLTGESADLENRVTLAHEIAHQWWGNFVGWQTYHDQWLSEGFASYAAALELAQEKDGDRLFRELLRGYRRDLLTRNKQGEAVESAGPIWLGGRLSSSLDPSGYDTIVYQKASWVIHMLGLLLTDQKTGSDAPFFRMLRGFVITYHGENPSTEDFVRYAEKYMSPAADLDHDHRLDWFFREWVYATGIPEYRLRTSTRRLANHRYLVAGTIAQGSVPNDFEMLVPLIITYAGGGNRHRRETRLAVAVSSSGGRFHFTSDTPPQRIAIDEDAILAVVH